MLGQLGDTMTMETVSVTKVAPVVDKELIMSEVNRLKAYQDKGEIGIISSGPLFFINNDYGGWLFDLTPSNSGAIQVIKDKKILDITSQFIETEDTFGIIYNLGEMKISADDLETEIQFLSTGEKILFPPEIYDQFVVGMNNARSAN